MSRSKLKANVRELLAVFDTNALWTQTPGDLISADMRLLLSSNSSHSDLKISWHLPEVVVRERHYQMKEKALILLKGFEKMEALLNLQIKLTSEDLDQKIAKVIEDQMTALSLARAPVNASTVDWDKVMEHAAFRIAPFERGETEKGFRDTLILETFCQLLASAPRAADRCRVVLVTNDKLLTEATQIRIRDNANAQVLPDLSALRNLINTLVSTVDEAYVGELREKADKLFFDGSKSRDTLYYKEDISSQIQEKFKVELAAMPTGADSRSLNGITIKSPPEFLKKENQRVFWATKITFKATASRTEYSIPEPQPSNIYLGGVAGGAQIGMPSGISFIGSTAPYGVGTSSENPAFNFNVNTGTRSLLDLPVPKSVVVRSGKSVFEVLWSARVNQSKKLTKLQIDGINFVETTWD